MLEHIDNIKQHYKEIDSRIMSRNNGQWVAPYTDLVRWELVFSPIEELTWHSLRSFGQCPLYPQYPVDKYFVDFGNPKYKVAIECDGKEWHQDKDKDAKRDKILLEQGWHIFRIDGAGCYKVCEEYHDRFDYDKDEREVCEILSDYYNTVDGLIKAISMFYFNYKEYVFFEDEIRMARRCLEGYISPVQRNDVMDTIDEKMNTLYSDYYNWKEQRNN